MVLTVGMLYKVAKEMEKDNNVINIVTEFNKGKKKKNEQLSLADFIIDCINNASVEEEGSLFEDGYSITLSTYNGRIYYIGEEDGVEKNLFLSNDTLKNCVLTPEGEKFIKLYLFKSNKKKKKKIDRKKQESSTEESSTEESSTEESSTEESVEE